MRLCIGRVPILNHPAYLKVCHFLEGGSCCSWLVGVILVSAPWQDSEEHGGELGEGDHAVSQHLRRQPGHSFLPLASLSFFTALRPSVAPYSTQHDEEAFPTVSEN